MLAPTSFMLRNSGGWVWWSQPPPLPSAHGILTLIGKDREASVCGGPPAVIPSAGYEVGAGPGAGARLEGTSVMGAGPSLVTSLPRGVALK